MPRKRLHLVAYWLAVMTVLVNAVAASAGLVRCEGPQGTVTLEVGCEHDHCKAAGLQIRPASHDHGGEDECACIDCECVDQSAAVKLVAPGSRSIDLIVVPTPTLYVVAWLTPPVTAPAALCATSHHGHPPPDLGLRALRTVRLLF